MVCAKASFIVIPVGTKLADGGGGGTCWIGELNGIDRIIGRRVAASTIIYELAARDLTEIFWSPRGPITEFIGEGGNGAVYKEGCERVNGVPRLGVVGQATIVGEVVEGRTRVHFKREGRFFAEDHGRIDAVEVRGISLIICRSDLPVGLATIKREGAVIATFPSGIAIF